MGNNRTNRAIMLGLAALAFALLAPSLGSSHRQAHDHRRCGDWYRQRYKAALNNQAAAAFAPRPIDVRPLARSDVMASMARWARACLDQPLKRARCAQ